MTEEKNITTTETKKFYYNSKNRMIKYEHYPTEVEPADIVAEYKYDIYGRRIQKNVNGIITNFHWEGDNMSFELNENHQPIRRYIYENGKDDVQGYVEYSEVDDPQYFSFERKGWYSYIKDQVGTITKVYKHETKQMVDTRTYDTFGNLINQTGSSNGNLRFQSKYFDQESGLNYYYHRYYYPKVGRFISEDPVGLFGGLNLFLITINNPVNYIDKFGLYDPHNNIPKEMKKFDELLNSPYQVIWENGEPWYYIPLDIPNNYLLIRPRECDEGMIGWDPYQGLLDMAQLFYDIYSLIPPTDIVSAIKKFFDESLINKRYN